jgi:hypothetical protein
VEADAHRQLHAFLVVQVRIQAAGDGVDDAQAAMQGTLGVIFVRFGPAKIAEQSITQILRNVALILVDHRRRRLLVGANHFTQVFGIELLGELGRVGEIAEHHSELPPFGLRARASGLRYGSRRGLWHVCGDGVSGDGRLIRWRTGLGDAWRQGGYSGRGD